MHLVTTGHIETVTCNAHAKGILCTAVMQRWAALNARQLSVLRRIENDADEVSAKRSELGTTVQALRNRGLVKTSWRNGVWRVEITDAGLFYLQHGHHPDRPEPGDSINVLPKRGPVESAAADLISALRHAEGETIRIEEPDDATRARYRKAINAAKRRGLVPEGRQLLHTGRDTGPLIIKLGEDGPAAKTDWNRIRLRVRDEVTGGDLLELLGRDQQLLKVSDGTRKRAVDLVQVLVRRADRRGHAVAASRKSRYLLLRVRDHAFTITISEEVDEVPRLLPANDPRVRHAYDWQRIKPPEYDSVPSGRLRIELSPRTPEAKEWADRGRSKIETKLTEVIDEAERQAEQAEEQARARQRAHQAWLVEYEKQQAEEERKQAVTRAEWKSAMDTARGRAIEELRDKTFGDALLKWLIARQIREFCTELERAAAAVGTPEAAAEWVAWARSRADQLDPVLDLRGLAEHFHPEVGPDDLRAHLVRQPHFVR
ncbi:hypothetical protein F8568_043885 [Actinomadura sp. LD22]|uniref:PE-PGRS family protein n=1 Tax=Actinomadura physcomitrii TaxID=2650748 RepID=A0A6I4MQZ5_9ACTN|nr:hypothetical protein [Actinomadura physcomitrii]MWA07165.1 hypothetical protein [Actinomadura physcomitrii]